VWKTKYVRPWETGKMKSFSMDRIAVEPRGSGDDGGGVGLTGSREP